MFDQAETRDSLHTRTWGVPADGEGAASWLRGWPCSPSPPRPAPWRRTRTH
ncbi:hypothetical protein ACFQ0B_77400 [Nonomuraea thailandensis]